MDDAGRIKEGFFQQMRANCPFCERDIFKGQVNMGDETMALYCTGCGFRVAVCMVVVQWPECDARRLYSEKT